MKGNKKLICAICAASIFTMSAFAVHEWDTCVASGKTGENCSGECQFSDAINEGYTPGSCVANSVGGCGCEQGF